MKWLILFIVFVCSVSWAKLSTEPSYSNQISNVKPRLVVVSALPASDFKTAGAYKHWQLSVTDIIEKYLKQYELTVDYVFKSDGRFQDVFEVAHDPNTVGLILISHGSDSQGLFNGQLFDSEKVSLNAALMGAHPNLRALGLSGCYTSQSMDSIVVQDGLGPFTRRISYGTRNHVRFVVPDTIKSVIKHLKNTEASWRNSVIRSNQHSRKVTLQRKLECGAQGSSSLGDVAIRIGSRTLGVMPLFKTCGAVQTIEIIVPESLWAGALMSVDSYKKEFPPGYLTSSGPVKIKILRDHSGNPLGKTTNIYNFELGPF